MFHVRGCDPALRASKVLREQHAARDADRYEWPQVIILDRADGGEEVKEEERQAHPSRSRRSHFREFFDFTTRVHTSLVVYLYKVDLCS